LNIRTLHLAAGLAVVFASTAMADIAGSTYNFSASSTGNTVLTGGASGTYTDPANPGFCVGPPNACSTGQGVSGGFTFADSTPTLSTITFSFFGSTSGAGPGSFSIDLGSFVLPDGDTITGVTYASGGLGGATSSVSGIADFTFSTSTDYNAVGGNNVVFDVAEAPSAVPEPSSIWLLGTVVGVLLVSLRKLRHA
jgi:hypothetical protein